MKSVIFSENFYFTHISLDTYHHTDNRAGCPRHYLAYMQNGTGRLVSAGNTLTVKAGDVFYIPKGLSYQSYWSADGEISFLSFGFHHFPETDTRQYALQVIACDEGTKAKLCAVPVGKGADSFLIGSFYSVLALLLPRMQYTQQNTDKAVIEKVRQYVIKHTDCKVGDMAKHCLISESALYEIFRKAAGLTPNELKQQVLCEKAVELLQTTDRSVQDISDGLGFSSASYFRKIMAKHLGRTPREIRKASVTL